MQVENGRQLEWQEMPTESLLKILSYLTPRELVSTITVSKSWQQLVEDDTLWRLICLGSSNFEVKEQEETQMSWKEIFCNRMTCSLQEYAINLLLLGERNQSKHSSITKFIQSNATIEKHGDITIYQRHWFHDFLTINLKLWDMTGQEDMGQVQAFKEICGAIVMVESNAECPLEEAITLKLALNANLPTVLLFNKGDSIDGISTSPVELKNFCKGHGFCTWVENEETFNEGFESAMHSVVKILTESEKEKEHQVNIVHGVQPPAPNKKCIIS